MKQRTIKKSVKISGVGLHTGVKSTVTLCPAKEDSGIFFIRTDLTSNVIIEANLKNVNSTERSTNLKKGSAEIKTVEHLLAAIVAANIDNLIIKVDNIEIPILDGSAKLFSETIFKTGIKEQNKKRDFLTIKKEIILEDKKNGFIFKAIPAKEYELKVNIDYNSKILGLQSAELKSISNFQKEISSSRTFCFLHELQELIEKNLIKGGDLNNAVVIVEKNINKKELDKLALLFNKKNITITDKGTLNNTKLRYKNEPARHKLLDLIGDLSLIGKPIKGKISAYKPGHKNNIKFAKYLENIMK